MALSIIVFLGLCMFIGPVGAAVVWVLLIALCFAMDP